MPAIKVNDKQVIKNQKFYHCFKLNDNHYALFDSKMDMPITIGSIAIIKSVQLPKDSLTFYYKLNSQFFFEKGPEKYIEIKGGGKHQKSPLRYNYIDPDAVIYHHFKLSPVLSVIFDLRFDMPLAHGSNQKVQAILNNINDSTTVFYYKEDMSVKNSFKFYMKYKGV
jgi:hypothetical protein